LGPSGRRAVARLRAFDQAGTERGPAVDPVITRVTRATPPSQP